MTARPATGTVAAAVEPKASFRDLLIAEWIKLWSLRSTCWGLAILAVLIIGANADSALADYNNWPNYVPSIKEVFVPIWAIRDAFVDFSGIILMLGAGSIGAITLVGEYSTGMIRTTFAAVPARRAVTSAKLLVVTAVMVGFGTVVSATSFWITQAILSRRGIGLSIGYPGAVQAVAASALLPAVSALVGMGLGALIRHTATTIVAVTGALLILPIVMDSNKPWKAAFNHALPMNAWDRLTDLAYGVGPPIPYPASVGESWIVFAAWPLVAAVLALILVDRRDL